MNIFKKLKLQVNRFHNEIFSRKIFTIIYLVEGDGGEYFFGTTLFRLGFKKSLSVFFIAILRPYKENGNINGLSVCFYFYNSRRCIVIEAVDSNIEHNYNHWANFVEKTELPKYPQRITKMANNFSSWTTIQKNECSPNHKVRENKTQSRSGLT